MANTTWSTTDKLNVTLSGSNLIATASGTGGVRGKDPKRTGKYYIEYTATTTQHVNNAVGFASAAALLTPGQNATVVLISTGQIRAWAADGSGAVSGSNTAGFTTGTIVGCAIDLDARLAWFRIAPAGNWNNSATNNPATGVGGIDLSAVGLGWAFDCYPYADLWGSPQSITANFGDTAFSGTVPSGYTSGWDDSVAAVSYLVTTQIGVEAWTYGAPNVVLTQIGVEAWAQITPANVIVTQVGVEAWMSVAAAPQGGPIISLIM